MSRTAWANLKAALIKRSPHLWRVNTILVIVLVATALILVRMQYEARQLYVQNEKIDGQIKAQEADLAENTVKSQTLSKNLRVDVRARERLGMVVSTPETTVYVEANAAPKRGGKP